MPLDPELLYNIAPSVAASPATLSADFIIKKYGGGGEKKVPLSHGVKIREHRDSF